MQAWTSSLRQRGPLLLASLPILALAAFCVVMILLRVVTAVPIGSWDAAGLVESDRFAQGLPLYEDQITGHPQWVYGPVMLMICGALFRLTGPSLIVMELVSLAGLAGVIALAWMTVRPWLSPLWQFVALCTFVAIEAKVAYFGTVRPDTVALALAFWALLLCYKGGLTRTLLAAVLLMVSVMTKQPMIIFAAVPPLACVVESGFRDWRALLLSVIPGCCVVVMFLCVKMFAPLMWLYMIEVAAHFAISRELLLKLFFLVLGGFTTIWVALAIGAAKWAAFEGERLRRLKWLAVSVAIAVPMELVAHAKAGGAANSMIPAFFLMMALAWLLISPILSVRPDRADQGMTIVFLLSLLFTFMPTYPARAPLSAFLNGAAADYREVIARTRDLQGSVLSPDDPTITLFARGQHDRTLAVDLDTLIWPTHLPPSLDKAYGTRYIVQKKNELGWEQLDLAGRGYRPVWENRTYAILERPAGR